MRGRGSPGDFHLGKGNQIAEGFKQFAVNLIIFNHDIETVFQFGEQPCHCHAVQFGYRSEKLGFRREFCDLLFAKPQNIPHYRTHRGFRR